MSKVILNSSESLELRAPQNDVGKSLRCRDLAGIRDPGRWRRLVDAPALKIYAVGSWKNDLA